VGEAKRTPVGCGNEGVDAPGVNESVLHKHADPMVRMTSVMITSFLLMDSSGCFMIHFRLECKEFCRDFFLMNNPFDDHYQYSGKCLQFQARWSDSNRRRLAIDFFNILAYAILINRRCNLSLILIRIQGLVKQEKNG
jgi:hypothetical protein